MTNGPEMERKLAVGDNEMARLLFGQREENLRAIERRLGVTIRSRGDELTVRGTPEAVERSEGLLRQLLTLVEGGQPLSGQDFEYALRLAAEGQEARLAEVLEDDTIIVTERGKRIRPKTLGQKKYVEAMRRNGLVFAIGPAGTGKTYLAMAVAIAGFKNRDYNRIVLTRPAVEAGEKLGFLPGDLQEKVDPYLRPLYDALYDILGADAFERYMGRGRIEVAPLAYMRGRTLDDSFVILDEAQNTTPEQMKMFLTRLGFGSKAVVTGDITQVDLPKETDSGLAQVREVLRGIEGIEFVYLSEKDVVRHPLVQAVIKAYERYDNRMRKGG